MTGQGTTMFFTHRRFGTVVLAASSLSLIAAVGVAITDAPPSGSSTPVGKPAPWSVRPNSVAINPTADGPRLQVKVPGGIADAQGVRGPHARLLGDTAGAVRVRGPKATPAGRSADRGTVPGPEATRPGNAVDGGSVPGPQATQPGDSAGGGTALRARVALLGTVIGAQATLR
jgi:hypothetical protein